MGMAHGLEVVLRAAEEMKEDRKTVFLLVGEGARKEELKERGRSLPNVRVLDSCPHAQVPEYIAASDLCLVHLRQSELFRTVLPSKMFEIMGCARPVLLGVEGEARATLEKAEAGVAFPPEDGHALAEAVRKLKADPAGAARLGENGRRFVEREFSRSVLAGRYSELLSALAARTALRPAQRYEAVQRLTE
jgi:glycosyltransferase involved in cell wall biosynthesis